MKIYGLTDKIQNKKYLHLYESLKQEKTTYETGIRTVVPWVGGAEEKE